MSPVSVLPPTTHPGRAGLNLLRPKGHMTSLEQAVANADTASVELHAAMLKFDRELGLLRREVQEIALREQGLQEIGTSMFRPLSQEEHEALVREWKRPQTLRDRIGAIA